MQESHTAAAPSSGISRENVRAALDALRIGRTPGAGKRYARSLLARYGDGAPDLEHLDPKFFRAVFNAAGGTLPRVCDSPQVFTKLGTGSSRRIRPDTALIRDLEKRLREGPKHARPTGFVNYGNPTLAGERRD